MRWKSALAFAVSVLAGCGGSGSGGGAPRGAWLTSLETDPLEARTETVDGRNYYFSQAAAGATIMIRPAAPNATRFELDGQAVGPGGWLAVRFDDLGPEAPKELVATNSIGAVVGRATLWPRPIDFPILRVESNGPTTGWTHLSIAQLGGGSPSGRPSFLTVLDEFGAPIFIRRKIGFMVNFNRVELNGSVFYTFNEEPFGIILDEDFREIDRFTLVPHNGSTWTEVDLHELLMLDVGHYVVPAYVPKLVDNDPTRPGQVVSVTAAVIQELRNGEVITQWDSTDHPELYAYSTAGNGNDYAHLNSIEIDPRDGHFVASFRHLDNVMKIHRTTGEILWILGGPGDQFGLTSEQQISHCHDARVEANGVFTLFDNGNASGRSRVLRFTLNEQARQVLTYEASTIDGHFSVAMGSAQFLAPGTVMAGWGFRGLTESDVTEWDTATGTKRLEIWLNENDTGGRRTVSYRARKYPPLPNLFSWGRSKAAPKPPRRASAAPPAGRPTGVPFRPETPSRGPSPAG